MIPFSFIKYNKIPFEEIIFLVLIFTNLFYSENMNTTLPSELHQANAMWIEPPSIEINNPGDIFNITVWVNITQKSFAWQVTIYFNSSYVNAIRIGYTNHNKSAFFTNHSTQHIIPIINNNQGYILHGETLLGSDEREPGYGSLMWVEFNLTDIPPQKRFTLGFSHPYGIETFMLENLPPSFDPIPFDTIEGVDIDVIEKLPDYIYIVLIILLVIIPIIVAGTYEIRRRRKRKNHE